MDPRSFLSALQLGDSLFPSGAFAQSYGLETLVADGHVAGRADLADLLRVHLRRRLALADLPALLAAHRAAAAGDLETLAEIDRRLTAAKLSREERDAGQRVGRRIATEVERLSPTPTLRAMLDGDGPCNAPVALGVAAQALGVDAPDAALLACYTFASGLVSAALRLMRIGHGDAQAVLRTGQPDMEAAVRVAASVDWREPRPFAPRLDIAMARHQRAQVRLFAS
jgi:urease accessory protein